MWTAGSYCTNGSASFLPLILTMKPKLSGHRQRFNNPGFDSNILYLCKAQKALWRMCTEEWVALWPTLRAESSFFYITECLVNSCGPDLVYGRRNKSLDLKEDNMEKRCIFGRITASAYFLDLLPYLDRENRGSRPEETHGWRTESYNLLLMSLCFPAPSVTW